jgi:hypothetical protein
LRLSYGVLAERQDSAGQIERGSGQAAGQVKRRAGKAAGGIERRAGEAGAKTEARGQSAANVVPVLLHTKTGVSG